MIIEALDRLIVTWDTQERFYHSGVAKQRVVGRVGCSLIIGLVGYVRDPSKLCLAAGCLATFFGILYGILALSQASSERFALTAVVIALYILLGLPLIRAGTTIRYQTKQLASGSMLKKSTFFPALCFVCAAVMILLVIAGIYSTVASGVGTSILSVAHDVIYAGAGVVYIKAGIAINNQRKQAARSNTASLVQKNTAKSLAKNVALVVVAGLALLIGLSSIASLSRVTSSDEPTLATTSGIIVGGTVTTTEGTYPYEYEARLEEIIFTDVDTNAKYTDKIFGTSVYGYYELKLPSGNHEYDVQVIWVAPYGNATGICDSGSFATDETMSPDKTISRDFGC